MHKLAQLVQLVKMLKIAKMVTLNKMYKLTELVQLVKEIKMAETVREEKNAQTKLDELKRFNWTKRQMQLHCCNWFKTTKWLKWFIWTQCSN